ncbi:type II toxin-antitoxin system HicB family antitoxin [Candidatus Kuenenia stuttgartiensis]|uniref:type II toxin-antitoxin system HicB family antitoxin n=1 Tax=Kuenenia stuttgartiensis TaxID=174633 RepID=UPI003B9682AC
MASKFRKLDLFDYISEGNTKEEALKNIREAIELYLEPVDDDMRYNPDAQVLEIAL